MGKFFLSFEKQKWKNVSGTSRSYEGKVDVCGNRLRTNETKQANPLLLEAIFDQHRLHTCTFFDGKTFKCAVTVFSNFDASKKKCGGGGVTPHDPRTATNQRDPYGGNLWRKINDRNYTSYSETRRNPNTPWGAFGPGAD